MLLKETEIRNIIKQALIKESVLNLFTSNKDTTPGEQLSFGKSNLSFQVLSSSKKGLDKEYYVLALWPSKKTPNKIFKDLPSEAWNSTFLAAFHDGNAYSDHSKEIANAKWLVKNYYFPKYGFKWKDNDHKSNFNALNKSKKLRKYIMGPEYGKENVNLYSKNSRSARLVGTNENIIKMAKKSPLLVKFAKKLKIAFKQGRVKAISTKWLLSNKEFKKKIGGDAWEEFVTDTSLEAVSAIADLGAKWFPPLEGVSTAAGLANALVKMGREDILGSAIALITTIPIVGDTIGLVAKRFERLGAQASGSIAVDTAKHLLKFVGKVLDGEFANAFENCVKAFCDYVAGKDMKGYSFGTFFPKIQNALVLFSVKLHKVATNGKWDAEREMAGLKQQANIKKPTKKEELLAVAEMMGIPVSALLI